MKYPLLALAAITTANAATMLPFNNATLTANIATECQLIGPDTMLTITNIPTGSFDTCVTAIYLEGVRSLDVASSGLVDFTRDDSRTLPGGNTIGWLSDNDAVLDARSPSPLWGINHGESVTIWLRGFNYQIDKARLAIHVQSSVGSSELFTTIPEPSALALVGLGAVVALRRRRAA